MTEWRKKRQTMRHYNQSAKVYDSQYYEEQEAKIKAALTELNLKKENLTLDTGCGTGLLFPHITEKVRLVVGVDISTRILKEAKKRVKEYANAAVIIADTDYAPFQNDTFDTIFAITLLQNTPKPHQTLKEMKRVTKQNATIIATGLRKTFSRKEFTQLLREAGLKINVLKLEENLKEYVATCTKPSKKTLKEQRQFCNSPEE
jgi:ubiquinone/menaquinone biosynthesis C-methylase UbiE